MSDYIPPELVTEILIRLPAKSLIRFRCVSKQWLTLILNPSFISKHISRSSPSPTHTLIRRFSEVQGKEIYTLHSTSSTTKLPFPLQGQSPFFTRVVAYCGGILCLSDDLFGYRESFTLWNPSINRVVSLPTPSGPYMDALGFGFDDESKDYKLVRVSYLIHHEVKGYQLPPTVEVFTVSTGEWRSLESRVVSKVKAFITENYWAQAVFQGFVHWNGYILDKGGLSVIVKFDLGKEIFGELDLPRALVKVPNFHMCPCVMRGEFCVIRYAHAVGVSIWVMKDYGDVYSWTEKYYVHIDWNVGMELGKVLGMRRDGEMMIIQRSGQLLYYNSESGRVTSTRIFGFRDALFVDEYVDSLALFDKGNLVEGEKVEVILKTETKMFEWRSLSEDLLDWEYFLPRLYKIDA